MPYATNTPESTNENNTQSISGQRGGDTLDVFIIPQWVFAAFTGKYNLVEIHEYEKLRQMVSKEDIAEFICVEDLVYAALFPQSPDYSLYVSNTSGNSLFKQIAKEIYRPGSHWNANAVIGHVRPNVPSTGPYADEFEKSIYPLSLLQTTKDQTRNRLLSDEALRPKTSSECYPVASCNYHDWYLAGTPSGFIQKSYSVLTVQGSVYITVGQGFLSDVEKPEFRRDFVTDVLKALYAVSPIRVVNRSIWYHLYVKALVA